MKKIAFMFAVAAMFVACGNGNKAAEEVAVDSTEVAEVDTTGMPADTIAAKFQAAVDSLNAAAAAAAPAAEEAAPAEEAAE